MCPGGAGSTRAHAPSERGANEERDSASTQSLTARGRAVLVNAPSRSLKLYNYGYSQDLLIIL